MYNKDIATYDETHDDAYDEAYAMPKYEQDIMARMGQGEKQAAADNYCKAVKRYRKAYEAFLARVPADKVDGLSVDAVRKVLTPYEVKDSALIAAKRNMYAAGNIARAYGITTF